MIVPDKLAASTVPVTLKLVKPVRFVMFAFVALTVPASTVPVTLKLLTPVKFVMFAFVALTVPIAAVPVTVRLFKVPNDVILG